MSFSQACTSLEATRAILFQRTQLLAALVDSGLEGVYALFRASILVSGALLKNSLLSAALNFMFLKYFMKSWTACLTRAIWCARLS